MKNLFLIKLFIFNQLSYQLEAKFQYIITLGDSITDTGNVYRESNYITPNSDYYYKGRFSNGPTWVEYLTEGLGGELVDYAYGGATSDDITYPVPSIFEIPGCLQQADRFIKDYREVKGIHHNEDVDILTSVSFFGNDFANPKATSNLSATNIDTCLRKILDNIPQVKHLIVPTSLAPELYPYFASRPVEVLERISKITREYCSLLKIRINKLREEYPHVNFYELDYEGLLRGLKSKALPLLPNHHHPTILTGSCIPFMPENPSMPGITPCLHPSQYLFYDGLHPTTYVHKAMAQFTLTQLRRHPVKNDDRCQSKSVTSYSSA